MSGTERSGDPSTSSNQPTQKGGEQSQANSQQPNRQNYQQGGSSTATQQPRKSQSNLDQNKKSSSGQDRKPEEKSKNAKKKNLRPLIILVVVLALIGLFVFSTIRNKPEGKPGWLRINGRIEGYEVNVGAKIAGRVEYISNREGEEVTLNQPLVRLSDEDIQAQLRGAKARYQESLESVREAQEQLKVAKEQVQQAKLNVVQSKEDAKGRIEQAAANVAQAKAQQSQAIANQVQSEADLELARIRKKRYDELVEKGAVTQDEDDQAHTTYESDLATVNARKAAVVAAERQVMSNEAALLQAKSNSLNPPIRLSQQSANTLTVGQNEAAVARALHDVKNARAAVDEIEANIVYLNINSPIHGVVTARTVEPGAVVAAGQTVISLLNLDTVFLRAYVPDGEIGKVRLGQKALVYYDSDPKHGVDGKVIEIDPKASFTPENIYFRDDRVKQVFGIKIMIDNPANYAKPGMPADSDIDIQSDSGAKST